MTSVKGFVRAALQRFGYEIHRRPDMFQLAMYERLYDRATLERKPFYNVGAGSFWHPYWTNVDYVSDWYSKVQRDVVHHDLMSNDALPIPDSSALAIYSEHTIEHVSESAVDSFFRKAFTALAPGGTLRVVTGPDAETDWSAMRRGDADWFYWDDELYSRPGTYEDIYRRPANSVPLEERWLHHVASALAPNDLSPSDTKLDAAAIRALIESRGFEGTLDYLSSKVKFDPQRPGNHISWWTHPKLLDRLRKAGFRDPYRSGHGQSSLAILRGPLFDRTHPQVSAYVEAIK